MLFRSPEIDSGPHLSYSLQWYAFAALFFVAWGYAARQQARNDAWDRQFAREMERHLSQFYDEDGNYIVRATRSSSSASSRWPTTCPPTSGRSCAPGRSAGAPAPPVRTRRTRCWTPWRRRPRTGAGAGSRSGPRTNCTDPQRC